MLDLLQRLAVPFVLLAAFIAATIGLGEIGNDDLPEIDASTTSTFDVPETPVFSIRRAPELLTSPRANEDLGNALEAWVGTLPENSCFVVNAAGERLFSHNSGLPLVPASNMKILTAVAALEELTPDFRFTTSAALQLPDENGTLVGDLYVVGGGDPLLMSDAYAAVQPVEDSPIRTRADELADAAVASNLSTIQGAVLVDESRYDQERAVSTWPTRFLEQSQAGSLSAAMLDDGFTGIADGYSTQQGTDEPPPLPRSSDPAALFAASFDDLLEARNVVITARAAEAIDTPFEQLVELTSVQSPPLSDIVAQMLINSDNTTAEMLTKELGYNSSGGVTPGSTTSGTLAVSEIINRLGLPDIGFLAFDGSGLSFENTVTCDLIAEALDTSHKDVLRNAMPIAGESGTLADDFLGTPFDGRLRAKTGFLSTASALSGYFNTDPGVELTFSLIINVGADTSISDEQIVGWQQGLPAILAPYPEGPPLELLGPKGVDLGS